MRRKLGLRLHDFYENHEKAFRTEIILVPILVLAIKLFENRLFSSSPGWSILFIIGISLLCYLVGILIITLLGDFIWRKFLFRYSNLYDYRGVYVQTTGADGRTFAVSRIFVNYSKGKYIYRGVAFNADTKECAAAWESELSYSDKIGNDPVLYFTGNSSICHKVSYDNAAFDYKVYSILCFTAAYTFRGAGFDFKRRDNSDTDYKDTFPIKGFKVDDRAMFQYGISDKILLDNPVAVYPQDRDAILKYALDADLIRR